MDLQRLLFKRLYTNETLYKNIKISSWNRAVPVYFLSSVFSVEICLHI